jgi:hypothetical protein
MGLLTKLLHLWNKSSALQNNDFITYSLKKSSRLRELQLKISPPRRGADELVSDFIRSMGKASSEKEQSLQEFLDLCVADAGVAKIMEIEQVTRSDLVQLYSDLSAAGLGQWVEGHYVALSTIAYPEPLLYAIRSKKRGVHNLELAANLLDYWEGKLPPGSLGTI